MKDMLHSDMQRDAPGPGYIHLPQWLPRKYLDELTTEARDEKGRWAPARGPRNETWDHFVYGDALWHHLGAEGVNWDRPPAWLRDMDRNVEVVTAEQRKALKSGQPLRRRKYDVL